MIDRRTLLTAGIGAATIATASASAAQTDAELQALGAEFDRLLPIVDASDMARQRVMNAFFESGANASPEGFDLYQKLHGAEDVEASRLQGVLHDLVDRIRATPAAALAGLAVKARMLRYELSRPCDNPAPREEWEAAEEALAIFIEEVERLAEVGRA